MLRPLASKCSVVGAGFAASLLVLSGCGLTAAGLVASDAPGQYRQMPSFALGIHGDAAVSPVALAPAAVSRGGFAPVQLQGRAYVPGAVDGVANLQDGYVSGSPVRVYDATSGKLLAQGVTYYDGSFAIDVPLREGQRAMLVASELVSKADPAHTIRLVAPVLMNAGTVEQKVVLSPGTTALVAFLAALAQEQAGKVSSPEASLLDGGGPGPVSAELSSLIAVFEPDAQASFTRLAEASPELSGVASLEGLANGIQRFVGRLTRSQVKAPAPRP